MASSEVAQGQAAQQQQHDSVMDTSLESTSLPQPQVNGHSESDEAAANASGFTENASLHVTDLDVTAKAQHDSTGPDINPAGPTPVDEVAPGIQPIADFVPKDASTHSHPTPPPDEPLATTMTDVDTEMANARDDAPPPTVSEAVTPSQPEQSLVRPREDDDDDEPAAKRTRVDEAAPIVDDAPQSTEDVVQPLAGGEGQLDQSMVESAPPQAENAPEAVAEEVDAKTIAAAAPDAPAETVPSEVKAESAQAGPADTEAVPQPIEKAEDPPAADAKPVAAPTMSENVDAFSAVDAKPADAPAPVVPQAETAVAETAVAPAPTGPPPAFSTAPMTQYQKTSLLEKMKNLKKTRHCTAFLKPVDPVAMNIPKYPDIIKQPMDLGTMERKLKSNEYHSVQDFVNDFKLIISNSRRFNGDQHVVTQAGLTMEAYFDRMMERVPTVDEVAPAPQKNHKKRSPSLNQEPRRRESRAPAASAHAAAQQAASPLQQESFALQSDGTPQIRRASSNVRPARAIKPPMNREIPYAKPRRKEHLMELKFSEHVLDEIRSPKYGALNHVFQLPVDPVALNIPNYRQIIKEPMDLSTMVQKMKSGQYGTAAEFKKDFELMVKNCLTFNPIGNPVRDLAVGLDREFQQLWKEKSRWEKKHAPASTRASSASGDAESDEEDEEAEEAAGGSTDPEQIAALKKQIAAMQSTLESFTAGPAKATTKSAKSHKKGASKKAGGAPAAANSKSTAKAAKPKRERLITYEEKDEISKAVERMDEKQIGKLTEIITRECPKYRDMEEMELEIDDLPNGVQLMLLKYVRDIFGGPTKKSNKAAAAARDYSPDDVAAQDDDDFEPKSRGGAGGGGSASRGGGGGGNKRKKHAPMNAAQQQEQLRALQGKLAEFSNVATSGSESPAASGSHAANAAAESSGDEESEESEEE